MSRYINFNGDIVPSEEPILPASNRAFRYGDGVFETIRYHNGRVLWLDNHHSRLTLSMHLLDLELPAHVTPLFLKREIQKVCDANELQSARVRFSVYREGEGHYTPPGEEAGFVVTTTAMEEEPYTPQEPIRLGTYTDHFKPFNRLAGVKSASALLYVLAGRWAKQHGFDEAIILNEQGRVAEAISSNIIILRDGELLTPAYTEACLDGIMKEVVMVAANRLNIDSRSALLTLDDLLQADEIWLTNTIRGIQWVHEWEGRSFGGTMAIRLQDTLRQSING